MLEDVLKRKLRITEERLAHIKRRAEMEEQTEMIYETLRAPEVIKKSAHDKQVLLYYKKYKETPVGSKYLLVGVKVDNGTGFVITAFFTNKRKKGETVWEKS